MASTAGKSVSRALRRECSTKREVASSYLRNAVLLQMYGSKESDFDHRFIFLKMASGIERMTNMMKAQNPGT